MDLTLLAAAVAPALILIVMLYRSDTADKEPIKLVAACFILGAVASVPIMICEGIAESVIGAVFDAGSPVYVVVEMTIGVALIEELFKLFAALIPTWKNDEFNYVFDGVLYCAVAALGFACFENVLYVFDGGLETAMVRAVMSVPSHMVDGILMGIFVGYAKYYKYRGKKNNVYGCFAFALIVPIIEHGIFDSLASLDSEAATGALMMVLLVEYAIALVIVVKKRGKNDILIIEPAKRSIASVAVAGAQAPDDPSAKPAAAPSEATAAPSSEVTDTWRPRYCRECGNALPSEANFCPSCGAKISG